MSRRYGGRVSAPRAVALEPEAYRLACVELIELWDTTSATTRQRDQNLARVLYGLALHVTSTTRAVLLLAEAGRYRDTYPLTRKCLEFAVTAQWLRSNGVKGLEGFGYESARNSKNMMASMAAAGMAVPPDVVATFSEPLVKADEAATARRFDLQCASFRGGDSLYVMYRHLSTDTHPSLSAVSMMLPDRASEADALGSSPAVPYYTCAFAMLLALRAADDVTLNKPRKGALQKVSRRLGLPSMLTPR
jgi:hypothetical protein